MTDFLKNAKPEFRKGFAKLGKHDWIDIEILPEGRFSLMPKDKYIREAPLFVQDKIYKSVNTADIVIHYTISRMWAFGPKVFYPTYEQCESFEQVEVDIPLEDYQQAFEVVIIYFPKEYKEKATKEFNWPCPDGVMCLRSKEGFVVFSSIDQHPAQNLVRTMTLKDDSIKTVEDSIMQSDLKMRGEKDESFSKGEVAQGVRMHRLAANLNLLLCQHPTRMFPSQEKTLAILKSINYPRQKRRELESEAELLPNIISFEQEIIVRRVVNVPSEGHGHASPNPHWRKGYWKTYSSDRFVNMKGKRQFINPILVNSWKFAGNLEDTQVNYKGK